MVKLTDPMGKEIWVNQEDVQIVCQEQGYTCIQLKSVHVLVREPVAEVIKKIGK